MNDKGFTLIEIICASVILGIIALICVPNISGYLLSTKASINDIDEKNLITSAKNYVIDCDYGGNFCKIPSKNNDSKVYLSTLIEEGYISNIKNAFSGNNCDKDKSYVLVKYDHGKYSYKVCLFCDGEYLKDCE